MSRTETEDRERGSETETDRDIYRQNETDVQLLTDGCQGRYIPAGLG